MAAGATGDRREPLAIKAREEAQKYSELAYKLFLP